jgi:hypothetical protein
MAPPMDSISEAQTHLRSGPTSTLEAGLCLARGFCVCWQRSIEDASTCVNQGKKQSRNCAPRWTASARPESPPYDTPM